jgi:hypothetical protein
MIRRDRAYRWDRAVGENRTIREVRTIEPYRTDTGDGSVTRDRKCTGNLEIRRA